MEILTTGREYFRKKLDEIDQEFRAFIVSESVSEVVKKKLHKEWFKHTIESNAKSMPFGKKTLKEKKKYSKEIKLRKIVILLTITLIIY